MHEARAVGQAWVRGRLGRQVDFDQVFVPGNGGHAHVDLAGTVAAVQVQVGNGRVAGHDVDIDAAAARRIDAGDAGVVGRDAHVLVRGKEGLVDFTQTGILARHENHGRAGPGAAGVGRMGVAAVQFDLDAVLAVFEAAR
jgi:hypothetical protein